MKRILNFFGIEIERFIWMFFMILVVIAGFITLLTGDLSLEAYFIGQSIVCGFGYVGSLMKKSKSEILSQHVKQLLVENKDRGSPIGIEPGFDNLNKIMKKAGPLLEQMTKNIQQSKHYRNRAQNNNNKQILTD